MSRMTTMLMSVLAAVLLPSTAAYACGFLIADNGAIRLDTFTAASILTADGDAHYVTSFSFNGDPEAFGAVIPLPAVPTEVEKAPGWFLQRLVRETSPEPARRNALAATADQGAEVLATYEVEALDITVLRGGGGDVLQWAGANGFDLGVGDGDPDDLSDATAMLDFYAQRSPVFAAIRFDNQRARQQGLTAGQGIPVRFSFADREQAWIPVKILTFDKPATEVVVADLFLMTPEAPRILGARVPGTSVTFQQDYTSGSPLVQDLTDDERAGWVPTDFTLTRIDVRTEARLLGWDIAAAVGQTPDPDWAYGVAPAATQDGSPQVVPAELAASTTPWWPAGTVALALAVAGAAGLLAVRHLRRSQRATMS